MKKDQPFKVPEDYFENLSDRIQEKIELEENPKKRVIQVLKPYIWMAASIIGIVFIAKVVLTNSIEPNYKVQQISQSEISVDTQNLVVDTDDLNWFSEEEEEELTSEEIIEYLSDYDIETETLLANL